jgi:hypothetical protein
VIEEFFFITFIRCDRFEVWLDVRAACVDGVRLGHWALIALAIVLMIAAGIMLSANAIAVKR